MKREMNLTPVTLKEARRFVDENHRHHKAPQGGLFAIGLSESCEIIGVAIVGRPVARMLDTGFTAEVTRLGIRTDRSTFSLSGTVGTGTDSLE